MSNVRIFQNVHLNHSLSHRSSVMVQIWDQRPSPSGGMIFQGHEKEPGLIPETSKGSRMKLYCCTLVDLSFLSRDVCYRMLSAFSILLSQSLFCGQLSSTLSGMPSRRAFIQSSDHETAVELRTDGQTSVDRNRWLGVVRCVCHLSVSFLPSIVALLGGQLSQQSNSRICLGL